MAEMPVARLIVSQRFKTRGAVSLMKVVRFATAYRDIPLRWENKFLLSY